LTLPGQVWVEIGGGTAWRLKVESQTEKSVEFSQWHQKEDGTWAQEGTRRVQKRALGHITERSRWNKSGFLPMGSTEFGEYPRTNADYNKLPSYNYAA
jgi:hypothetical protein